MRFHRLATAVGLLAGFLLLLLYLTLSSAPAPPPTGIEHSAAAAQRACSSAVEERVEGARFPFSPTATYLGEARYRLRGFVDAGPRGERVRRNFTCVVSYRDGAYRTDSLEVWQSH